MHHNTRRGAWRLIAVSSAIAAGMATRTALSASYRAMTDEDPPRDPTAHDTGWPEALAWAAVTGAVVGLSKLVAKAGTVESRRRLGKTR